MVGKSKVFQVISTESKLLDKIYLYLFIVKRRKPNCIYFSIKFLRKLQRNKNLYLDVLQTVCLNNLCVHISHLYNVASDSHAKDLET